MISILNENLDYMNRYYFNLVAKGPYYNYKHEKYEEIPESMWYLSYGFNPLPFFNYSRQELEEYKHILTYYTQEINEVIINKNNLNYKLVNAMYDVMVKEIVENIILHKIIDEYSYLTIYYRDGNKRNFNLNNILVFSEKSDIKALEEEEMIHHINDKDFIQKYIVRYYPNRICFCEENIDMFIEKQNSKKEIVQIIPENKRKELYSVYFKDRKNPYLS